MTRTKQPSNSDSHFKVSQSKVKTYRRCHRAYHNKYVEKLKRKRVKRPLMFGRMVHEMLEADANGDDPFELLEKIDLDNMKLFTVEKEQYGEIVENVGLIMEEYFNYWPEKDLRFLRRDGKSAEHSFEIEILDGILWNGKIDAVGRTPNGLKWLVEHKTFTKKPNEDERWRNLQSSTYIRANDLLGWFPNIDGTLWDYIRSKDPAQPGVLADGKLSSKAIDSLPSAIRAAIRRHGLSPRDYKPLIGKMETNRSNWFDRIHTPVSREVVDRVFDDFLNTVREMSERHGKCSDMNIERHCSWCDYEQLCRAELTGGDVDYLKKKEYYIDDKERQEIGDEPTE